MTTIATICARGGSTGLPGKNIKLLHGKPLICYSIEQALSCDLIDDVYVSTDDEKIAEIARQAGAKVPFIRPAHLATKTAAKIPVIEHLVEEVESMGVDVTTIVDLDPTSPLRIQEDIKACVELLTEDATVVITGFEAEKNPYFNMVEAQHDGSYNLVKQNDGSVVARQLAPDVFSMNASIYVWHRHTLKHGLWNGYAKLHVMPRERSIDIDSLIDFKIVELFMAETSKKIEQ